MSRHGLLPLERSAVIGPVAPVDAGEDGLQTVVIALGDRIEFMIVAAGAVHGEADEGGHGTGDHVISVDQARSLFFDGPLAELDVTDEIPGSGGEETRGHDGVRLPGVKNVTGDLLPD